MDNSDTKDAIETKDNAEKGEAKLSKSQKRFRMFKTCVLVLTWVSQGMRTSMGGAVLPDLRERLNATTAEMSYAFAFGYMGATLGAPLAIVTDRFGNHADMIICGILSIGSVIYALKPMATQIWAYATFHFLENLLFGSLPPMGNSVLLAIWGKGSTAAIQALHMGWPIGQIFGPLIAIPFVSDQSEEENTENGTSAYYVDQEISSRNKYSDLLLRYRNLDEDAFNEDLEPVNYNLDDRFRDSSSIQYAYWIVSGYMLLMAGLFVIMECMKSSEMKTKINKKSSNWKEIMRPSHWTGGDATFGVIMFLLLAMFFVMHIGCSTGIMIYITSYAVDSDLGFSYQEGALLNAILNASGTLARFIAILTAKWISNLKMAWVLIHGELVAALLFIAWGNKTKVGLWVTTILFGAIHRPIWGAAYVWVNQYLALLAIVIAMLNFTTNFFGIFQVSLFGYCYDNTVIDSIFYLCSMYGALACFFWYGMYYLATKHGTRAERLGQTINQQEMKVSEISKQDDDVDSGRSSIDNASYEETTTDEKQQDENEVKDSLCGQNAISDSVTNSLDQSKLTQYHINESDHFARF